MALAWACAGASAATFVHIDSPDTTYTTANGTIQAVRNISGGVTVLFDGGGAWLHASFRAGPGQAFAPGSYVDAQTFFQSPATRPGIGIFASVAGPCSAATGRFDVLDVAYTADGSVARFAADFQHTCIANGVTITGALRFNSDIALGVPTPMAFAGLAQLVDEGANVVLDGTASRDPAGGAISYEWSQTGGPAVTLANPSSASPSFTAPAVAPGGADLTFELRVTNAAGATSTATALVHVMDEADARNFLILDSDPGDMLGQGISRRYGPNDGLFQASRSANYVAIQFTGVQYWNFGFGVPVGQTLVPGTYSNAQRSGFGSPVRPQMEISGNNTACNTVAGTFVVHELAIAAGGALQSFAADFVNHCDGAAAALFGSVRINSAIAYDALAPLASGGPPQTVDEGATVVLDASASEDPSGSPLTFAWSQTGGPAVTLANASSLAPSFTAPEVGTGGADLAFQVRVTNGAGRSATANVTVHVTDLADPHTYLVTNSDAGDYVGAGLQRRYTTSDGTFTAIPNIRGGVSVAYNGGPDSWSLDFGPASGRPFVAGTYLAAERYAVGSPARAGLEVRAFGRGCAAPTGLFTVHEVVLNEAGLVQSFAADFEQHCDGASAALRGMVRFNSSVALLPETPIASAGLDQVVDEGHAVTLDGSASRNPKGGSLIYAWTQLGGPGVTLSNPSSATPSFTAPAVAAGGADLTFQLRVTNVAGLSSSATVTIHVRDASDPRTFIQLDSEPGEPLADGIDHYYTPADGEITAVTSGYAGVTVRYNGGAVRWALDFAPPTGQAFRAGSYFSATRVPTSTLPRLEVSGLARTCGTSMGQFTVLELVIVGDTVQKFAADFVQRCEGTSPALTGSVRFNSNIPVGTGPAVSPGRTQLADEGDVVMLDGSASRDAAGGPVSYSWVQISGPAVVLSNPGSATPTFTAPAVAAGGATLVFRLTVTDASGATAAADVSIRVLDAADPHTFLIMDADPGDGIGQGMLRMYKPLDGDFTSGRNFRGGVSIGFDTHNFEYWTLDFAAAAGEQLRVGAYSSAQRFISAQAPHPALDVSGTGRGCNTLTGDFTVLDLLYAADGSVVRFAADFVQHCDGDAAALRGNIRFNSAVPVTGLMPRVSLATNTGPDLVRFGSTVTLTATVRGAMTTPTGSVTFRFGSAAFPICGAVPVVLGTATCTTTSLPPGTYNVTASYSGNALYNPAASTARSVRIDEFGATGPVNWALASNGGTASASSSAGSAYDVASVIDGVRSGVGWGSGTGGWRDNTPGVFPDWVEVRFIAPRQIFSVTIHGLQDSASGGVEPDISMIANTYALRDFTVQGWNGSAWVDLAAVTGNFLVKRPVAFAAFTTDRIRVNVNVALANYTRIVEIEAWGAAVATGGGTEPPSGRNVALGTNGAHAFASSTGGTGNYPVASVIDGVRSGVGWGTGGGWKDGTANAFPDWVQVSFFGPRTVDRVVVYSLQDVAGAGIEPADSTTFTAFGITAFTVETWNGSAWVVVGSVTGNNRVKRTVTFAPTTTDRIRVNITGALGGVSRVVEVEAWEPNGDSGGGVGASPANVALSSAGAVATASSTGGAAGAFPASAVNNGDVRGVNWGAGGGWKDASPGAYPDWVQIDFNAIRTIDRVVVYSLQDAAGAGVEPTDAMTFTSFGVTAFTVEAWNGAAWVAVGGVSGNNLVKATVTFAQTTTDKIRVIITNALGGVSRLVEIEAWEPGSGSGGGTPPARSNVALASAGGVASASTTGGAAGAFPAGAVNNGDVRGLNWGAGGGWKDATPGAYPDWVQIDFNGTKTIDQVVVYSLQDSPSAPVVPTDAMTFSSFGLVAFTVEAWTGSAWNTLATVAGNNLVKRSVSFTPYATTRIRVNITAGASDVSRMVELEAWGN